MSTQSSFSLRPLLEKEKLARDGANFVDWYRHLTLALRHEKREYLLTTPYPAAPSEKATEDEQDKYNKHVNDETEINVLILACLEDELQKDFMEFGLDVMGIVERLKNMFQAKARTERGRLIRAIANTKLAERAPVGPHVMQMASYFRQLDRLETPFAKGAIQDFILNSLPESFSGFVMNFRMQGLDKTVDELQDMLQDAEEEIKKSKGNKEVLAVSEKGKKVKKKNRRSKKKGKGKVKPQASSSGAPEGVKKKTPISSNDTCHHCGKKGHWKRNCHAFLALKKVGKVPPPEPSGTYVIEINLATSSSDWIFDTGSCAHICRNVQALKNSRQLEKGELQLRVGNGSNVSALAVGCVELSLPSGFVLELKDVYFVLCITRNIISMSCLDLDGYSFVIKSTCCSFYRDDVYFGSAHLINGLYVLEKNKHTYAIENDKKRQKISHESTTFMWHCRLGHINEKRLRRLQSVGLLGQFEFESIDTCESCLKGKMTKTPFTKKGTRASELLELIHTDVCGPMSTCARGGFQYFITFTDDFSRYGYVYLMRHKSESLTSSKSSKMKWKTNSTRKSKSYVPIEVEST